MKWGLSPWPSVHCILWFLVRFAKELEKATNRDVLSTLCTLTELKDAHEQTQPQLVKSMAPLIGPPRCERTKFKFDFIFHLPSLRAATLTQAPASAYVESASQFRQFSLQY